MSSLYGVFGASGMGRETMPLLRQTLRRLGLDRAATEAVFIDDTPQAASINGHDVLNFEEFAKLSEDKYVCLAIGDSRTRARLAVRCRAASVGFVDVRSDTSIELDANEIGPGLLLSSYAQITSNVRIGEHFQANIYSYVAHDCVVGDYVTLAPAAKINGAVVLEDHVYVGTGAIIRQGSPSRPMVIGEGAVIGMGAVVTRSVPPSVTVVGNPARPLDR